jgi:hypothetical protein
VRIAASSNGEQKKALAAWERWCSENKMRSAGRSRVSWILDLTHILSRNQFAIACRNAAQERGNVWRDESRMRSNFRNGFS